MFAGAGRKAQTSGITSDGAGVTIRSEIREAEEITTGHPPLDLLLHDSNVPPLEYFKNIF